MGKILVLEDEIIIRKWLVKIIEDIDKKLEVFDTGSSGEALKIAEVEKIDIFILDIQVEDYSGLILAEQIRKMDIYKLTPIIFITGDTCSEIQAYRNIHCYTYIRKPFTKEVLIQVLKDIITYGIIEKQLESKILIKEKGFKYVIYLKDIIYVEGMSNDLLIKTDYEELEIKRCSLKNFSKQLTNEFVQCHKSFIVNCAHVKTVDKINNSLHFRNINTCIPIGRKYRENVLKSLNDLI